MNCKAILAAQKLLDLYFEVWMQPIAFSYFFFENWKDVE